MGGTSSLLGQAFSHYRIVEKLGGGGMGVVYKAEDARLRRFVALKFLPDDLTKDPQALARFQREAQAASALNHPGICTTHDIGEDNGSAFIAMEYLEGQTLRQLINGHALELEQLLGIAIEVAERHKLATTRVALVTLLVVGAAVCGVYSLLQRRPLPFRNMTITKVTDSGNAYNAAISPGRRLAQAAHLVPIGNH